MKPQAERPPFPVAVRSSLLRDQATCETKAYWAWYRAQVPKARSIHLHSGAAFASAIEAARKAYYIKGASQEEAAGAGLTALWKGYGVFDGDGTEQKSWNRMSGAFVAYLDEYPFATDQLQPYYFLICFSVASCFPSQASYKMPKFCSIFARKGRLRVFPSTPLSTVDQRKSVPSLVE